MKCNARVQTGTYTYAARNSSRQCENKARENGYCHKHQPVEIPAAFREAAAAIRAELAAEIHAAR